MMSGLIFMAESGSSGCGRTKRQKTMKQPTKVPCQNALMPRSPRLLGMTSIRAEPISAPPCYWMRPSRGRGRSTACRASRRKWNLQIGDQQAAIAKEGRVEALVGQRPFEMGYKAPSVMIDLIEGKKVDDPVFTGLDECTKDTADTCIQK